MPGKSDIHWTDATWNPVTGCSKVSLGCEHCYAEALSTRFGWTTQPWTMPNAAENVVLHPDRLEAPLKWRQPRRVFVNSMSDLFHEQVPDDFIIDVFGRMALAQAHTFQILTKRPERMLSLLSADNTWFAPSVEGSADVRAGCWFLKDWPLPNVWLGVSCEDQRRADEGIPLLLQIPAAVRFVSAEPLLGTIDLTMLNLGKEPGQLGHFDQYLDALHGRHCDGMGFERNLKRGLDWVIVGGESGAKHRPMDLDWARAIRDQCQEAGVAFFYKQSSGPRPGMHRLLDGREWNEYPDESRDRR